MSAVSPSPLAPLPAMLREASRACLVDAYRDRLRDAADTIDKTLNTMEAPRMFLPRDDAKGDPVNHPQHYTSLPARCSCGAGIEAIQVIEWLPANLANVVKYCWRQGLKTGDGKTAIDAAVEDLRKAVWYAQREIARLESMRNQPTWETK
jgi:hypothetical protein